MWWMNSDFEANLPRNYRLALLARDSDGGPQAVVATRLVTSKLRAGVAGLGDVRCGFGLAGS